MSPRSADAAMEEHLSLLGSEHGDYQNAVEWFRAQGEQAIPPLIAALQRAETTYLQKGRIIEVLGDLRADAAVPLLATTLQSGELSWETTQALGKIGSEEAEDTLIRCLGGGRLRVVKECTRALGHIRSAKTSAALQRQLLHDDPSVRYYAVQSLINSRGSQLEDILREHLTRERDPDIRGLIEELLE